MVYFINVMIYYCKKKKKKKRDFSFNPIIELLVHRFCLSTKLNRCCVMSPMAN